MTKQAPVLCGDLRLSDHEALTAAIQSGSPVLPIDVLDDEDAEA